MKLTNHININIFWALCGEQWMCVATVFRSNLSYSIVRVLMHALSDEHCDFGYAVYYECLSWKS